MIDTDINLIRRMFYLSYSQAEELARRIDRNTDGPVDAFLNKLLKDDAMLTIFKMTVLKELLK